MLTIQNLEAGYGHIAALKGVDVTVGAGEFVAILGPTAPARAR
jgi:ABC-type branched-chain amino acid transport systems, ATPase component